MDNWSNFQVGETYNRSHAVACSIVKVRGELRQIGSQQDGTPIYTDELTGPEQFAETLSYDVLVEVRGGPAVFEKIRPFNDQWPNPIKVRVPRVGAGAFGFEVGGTFMLWVLPMPSFGPCDTAPPPAGAAAASVTPPAGPTPPPREVPGEVPYDPSTDPVIIDNSKGYTSGPETDSLGPTSGDA